MPTVVAGRIVVPSNILALVIAIFFGVCVLFKFQFRFMIELRTSAAFIGAIPQPEARKGKARARIEKIELCMLQICYS